MVSNNHRGHALRIAFGITILVLLLIGSASSKSINDNATGGDCYSIGTWTPTSKTCTLTTDFTETVQIDSDGVTLDGDGHTLTGSNTGNGVYLYGRTGVTLKNLNVKGFYNGIYLFGSSDNTLIGNNASNNNYGIISEKGSGNNTLIGNNASNNFYGIHLFGSSNNTLSGNTANSNNGDGIILGSGDMHTHSYNNTLVGNTANSNNGDGIYLFGTSYNMLSGNTANSNNGDGIILYGSRDHSSSYNTLNGNTANSNKGSGIYLQNNNPGGSTSYNMLSSNTFSNNSYGISLESYYSSSDNRIYNNFFNNTINFYFRFWGYYTVDHNYWNETKISGTNIVGGPYIAGNFWAYPNGSGFSQTCTDDNKDGICNSPYVLDANNTDYLPLSMNLNVRYTYGGILPPINADGTSIFKLGSTIHVKFQLKDVNGSYISNAVAKIYVAKISGGMVGTEMEANSTSNATTGNLFRYDSTSNQYIFNLATKTLSTGTWQIRIELDDGTSKYVTISLR